MSRPNPCQPATVRDFAAAEFAADIADDEARYPAPHVHTWQIYNFLDNAAICLACRALLTRKEVVAILNKHAQEPTP